MIIESTLESISRATCFFVTETGIHFLTRKTQHVYSGSGIALVDWNRGAVSATWLFAKKKQKLL